MKRLSRQNIARILTAIYLVIAAGPLAPFAMNSKSFAHAITGECAGDCNICGCSPENRANHTCCCWKKKLQHEHTEEQSATPECCKKKHQSAEIVLSCACPCGKAKPLSLAGFEKFEQYPFRFQHQLITPPSEPLLPVVCRSLASRLGEPPDPPPIISLFS